MSESCTFIVNSRQEIILADRNTERLLGWKLDELPGKRLQGFLPDVDLEGLGLLKEQMLIEQSDVLVRHKNGEALFLPCRFSALFPDGVAVSVFTEPQKRAHTFNAQYFFDANIIGMLFSDTEGQIIDANGVFLNLLGYTTDDFQKKRFGWRGLIPDEYVAAVENALTELKAYGLYMPFELQLIRKDGKSVDVLVGGGLEEGSNCNAVSFVLDISARKQAEEKLMENEKLFRTMADSSNVMIWLVGPDLELKYLNKTVSDYVGVSMEEWGWWGEYVHPDDRDALFQVINDAIQNKAQYIFKHRVRRYDGIYRWWFASGGPVFDEEGEFLGYIGTAFDINELKEAQDELERYAKRLERSNKDLEHFATIASHDLQEPLRKIILFSDYLKKRELANLSEEGLDDFGRIQRAAYKMQRLIGDLLDLSRVIRRGQPFQKTALHEVTQDVIAELVYAYPDAKERIALKEGEMVIEADPNQIHQMMSQLLDNALKFHIPEKPSRVRVSIQPADQGQCQIRVDDDGLGMKPEHLDKIFDTFVRLHHGVEYPGTGIGLALVQKIVERHGGSIQVESMPGEGSSFTVTLPVTQEGR